MLPKLSRTPYGLQVDKPIRLRPLSQTWQAYPSCWHRARTKYGPIGILVNNAGTASPRKIFENTVEDFDHTLQANVRSAFALTQAVFPEMRDQNFGRLIFLSSLAAVNGGVVSTAYAASKAALLGMMHSYAAALIDFHITSNAIAPALVESDMVAGLPIPPPETMPLGRPGRPSEVGHVARLLVECGYINGQTIHLNAVSLHDLVATASSRFSGST